MPIYEFECNTCRTVFEELVRSSEAGDETACPMCGGVTHKRMSTFSGRMGKDKHAAREAGGCSSGNCCLNGACELK